MKSLLIVFAVLAIGQATPCTAASPQEALEDQIRQADGAYWNTFNLCDLKKLGSLLADDVEFYHDVVGVKRGKAQVIQAHQESICGIPDLKLRREAMVGTVRIFPLRDMGKVYGAIVSGEHQFFASMKGAPEVLEGRAQFTHLMLLGNGEWKLSRIYAHGPAGQERK